MQDNTFSVTNFLVYQKVLDIGPLISRQLNDFAHFFVFLNGSITGKILFKGFANAFDIQVIGQARNRRDTFTTVALLYADVDLFFRTTGARIARIVKGV